ncbi:MAG: hypothetical protein HRT57_10220, partial [Crocinitomicaceae bacterium]|nr:hypothetical protein [Crocinitomicaceae bacterium]
LIIIYIEAAQTTVNQTNEFFDHLKKLVIGRSFHMVVDLTGTGLPKTGGYAINVNMKDVKEQILSHHAYIGKNVLMKVALKFVASAIGLQKTKAVNSIDHAIKLIKDEF